MVESTVMASPPAGLRARKKARTRGGLYGAAMRLFAARGFDAVTIDEICREADVARATFFLHYPTKDALLTEYADQATEALAALLASLPKGVAPGRRSAAADLRLAISFLAERAEQHGEVVKLLVREVLSRPAAWAQANAQSRGLVALLAMLVRRGQASGEFRRGVHPELAAGVLAATYLSIVAEWAARRDVDLTDAVGQALDLMLHGLCSPRPARKGGPARRRRAG
jgi:AcrR family transcriptional regulator